MNAPRRGGACLLLAVVAVSGCRESVGPADASLPFVSVAAGGDHTCASTEDGRTYCWGANDAGQLGDGSPEGSDTPQRVATEVVLTDLVAGARHGCGLDAEGRAWCWGDGRFGQLGDGGEVSKSTPTPVAGDLRFSRLTAGWYHTCGIAVDGSGYCWGYNGEGELGDGTIAYARSPVPIAGDMQLADISAGGFHTCALDASHYAWCWGLNAWGQLGIGSATSVPVPTAVSGGRRYASIAAGRTHTCAATSGSLAYCWGSNRFGEVGAGFSGTDVVTEPRAVLQPSWANRHYSPIAAGDEFACALSDGDPYCWGRGDSGQIGDGTILSRTQPWQAWPRPSLAFRELSVGKAAFACAVSTQGSVYCWGTGETGQLGIGGVRMVEVPTPISRP